MSVHHDDALTDVSLLTKGELRALVSVLLRQIQDAGLEESYSHIKTSKASKEDLCTWLVESFPLDYDLPEGVQWRRPRRPRTPPRERSLSPVRGGCTRRRVVRSPSPPRTLVRLRRVADI